MSTLLLAVQIGALLGLLLWTMLHGSPARALSTMQWSAFLLLLALLLSFATLRHLLRDAHRSALPTKTCCPGRAEDLLGAGDRYRSIRWREYQGSREFILLSRNYQLHDVVARRDLRVRALLGSE